MKRLFVVIAIVLPGFSIAQIKKGEVKKIDKIVFTNVVSQTKISLFSPAEKPALTPITAIYCGPGTVPTVFPPSGCKIWSFDEIQSLPSSEITYVIRSK